MAEQPRLSLEARRAYHGFLTQPIARQALLVVAPEYNRFAPVLAKPVRPGLHALARGSLLQNYALAVAVARLTENPVEQAAEALAAADAEGETCLRKCFAAVALGDASAGSCLFTPPFGLRGGQETHAWLVKKGSGCNAVPQIMLGFPQISASFVPQIVNRNPEIMRVPCQLTVFHETDDRLIFNSLADFRFCELSWIW